MAYIWNTIIKSNFFHLNLTDQQGRWIAEDYHVSTDLVLVCVIKMYNIISKWIGPLQNAISLPNVTGLLFLNVWNWMQRYKTQYWNCPIFITELYFLCCNSRRINTEWLKKMDSISYVYIFLTIHGMWMIYITFERGGAKFSNNTARVFA